MTPILCSRKEGGALLGVGMTTLDELISTGQIQSVKIGNRRLLKIASLMRLAGVESELREEG